jgi:hypothetical protein
MDHQESAAESALRSDANERDHFSCKAMAVCRVKKTPHAADEGLCRWGDMDMRSPIDGFGRRICVGEFETLILSASLIFGRSN